MAEKLSRIQRNQALRDRLDEETTAAQEDKSHQQSGFARLSRTQHRALSHASRAAEHESTSYLYGSRNDRTPVMEDLLGEVKQYNIEQGNRITDDTQINILRQLDPEVMHTQRRNTHIVPMEEEPGEPTARIKPAMDDIAGIATYMPNQKLTRINPITSAVPQTQEPEERETEEVPVQPEEPKRVILGNEDILADDQPDNDYLNVFDPSSLRMDEPEVTEETSKKKKKSKKKAVVEDEIPSAKIRMSTRELDDLEAQPKSRSNTIINVILIVLVILLIASLGATFYFITQMGA